MLIDMSKSFAFALLLTITSLALLGQSPPAEKKAGGMLDLSKLLPKKEVVEEKPVDESLLTPAERFSLIKGRAELGLSQSQYELGILYLQIGERPVPLDYYEAYKWLLKATMKNHRMAQFHLGSLYENGTGTEQNLESALRWRRSSALLGCKQSQRWMAQIYQENFDGSSKYSSLIKKDSSNLIEAYAWLDLASEVRFPQRLDPKKPGAEELAAGDPVNMRDYNAENRVPRSAGNDRDRIAQRPLFTGSKQMYDDAKARCATLRKESEDYRAQNRPK
jgi:TPR repeat protein